MQRALISAAILSIGMLVSAQAQTVATATTDLNIRSGPGPEHPVIGNIQQNQRANVLGCIEGSLWCQIDFRGQQGWAYSQYMELDSGGRRVVIREPAQVETLPTVTYRMPAAGPVTTGVATRSEGVVVTRPDGVVTRMPADGPGLAASPSTTTTVIATAPDPTFAPPPAVGTYVTSNRLDPVTFEGEVVVGAGIPQNVRLSEVPDYRYQYVYVNDRPVLVDPATRRIVYVFR